MGGVVADAPGSGGEREVLGPPSGERPSGERPSGERRPEDRAPRGSGSPFGPPLPRTFYDRPPRAVARDLLGAVVVHSGVAVSLTEVEAYEGAVDPASHAFRGPTGRNAVMFGPPGHAYVYFTYGMHWCLNTVCGPGLTPGGVLLRAGAVVDGWPIARERGARRRDPALARGPACLTQVLAVDRERNGADLTDPTGELTIVAGQRVADGEVRTGPRIGIRVATERPWRYWVAGAPSVSGPRSAVGSPLSPPPPPSPPPSAG